MRALVTGGAGFIGSHLCESLLAAGNQVWCVDNLHLGREAHIVHLRSDRAFTFETLDLRDEAGLDALFARARFDFVYHLAANSDIVAGSRDRRVDLELGLGAFMPVLECTARHGVRSILLASSSAVFGEREGALEEDRGPMHPISFYGAAKLSCEAWLSAYAHHVGLRALVLRLPNVVGPRATHGVLLDFITRLRADRSKLVALGNGEQRKPYLHVTDLMTAIECTTSRAWEGLEVYHVAGKGDTSVRTIAAIVLEEAGFPSTPVEFAEEARGWTGDVPKYAYDTGRIEALGWKCRYHSTAAVRQAVREMLAAL